VNIATYVDGRPLDFTEATCRFDVGGAPVTSQDVLALDRAGQLVWVSPEMRTWAYQWAAAVAPGVAPAPAAVTGPALRGVGWWLLFLCISLTILNPLMTAFNLISAIAQTARYFRMFPGLLILSIADVGVSCAIAAFSIYAGVVLWRVGPNAVKVAKTYLIVAAVYAVVAPFSALLAGLPAASNGAIISAAIVAVGRGLIYVAIWYAYLMRSKRVQATYAG